MEDIKLHLNRLFSSILAFGSFGNGIKPQSEASEKAISAKLSSIEITIPMAILGPESSPSSNLVAWLYQATNEVLVTVLPNQGFERTTIERLCKAAEIGSKPAGELLERKDVVTSQVLLDFVQKLLAVAFDEREGVPNPIKGNSQRAAKTAKSNRWDFDHLSQQLAHQLHLQFSAKVNGENAPKLRTVVETQKLRDIPAHALTYIKLMITGDGAEIHEMDCSEAGFT
jgi:hypothetical protein